MGVGTPAGLPLDRAIASWIMGRPRRCSRTQRDMGHTTDQTAFYHAELCTLQVVEDVDGELVPDVKLDSWATP